MQVLQGIRHALQKVRLALIESTKAISSESLHDAHVNVGVVVLHELFAVERNETGKRHEIVIQQLPAQFRGQIRLAIRQERGNVILKRASAAALVIQEVRTAIAPHEIGRLEVAVKKITAVGGEQELS